MTDRRNESRQFLSEYVMAAPARQRAKDWDRAAGAWLLIAAGLVEAAMLVVILVV